MSSSMHLRVRAVVFDLDGTLVDSYVAITESLNDARSAFGLPPLPLDEVRRFVGRGLESLLADLLGPERVEHGVQRFRSRYARVWSEGTLPVPGALETVQRLSRVGLRLSVASNKPARFGRAICRALGFEPYLDAIHGPDTVGTTKPEPAMLRHCLGAMGATANDAVYVGDMVLDVETAARAGVGVVLVSGGSSDADALRATGKPVLASIADLPGWLGVT